MNKIKFIEERFREIFFSFVMVFALIAVIVVFAEIPSMKSFMNGSYLLAFCFASAFLFCQGHSLPNKKVWERFGDVLTIWLIIMFMEQLVMVVYGTIAFGMIEGWAFLWLLICLICAYLLVFFMFVIQFCNYKESKEEGQIENQGD